MRIKRTILVAYIINLIAVSLIASIANALEIQGIAKVVDGDTIHIEGYKLRLAGVDAPRT